MPFCLGRKALNTNVVGIGTNPRRGENSLGGLLDFGVPAQSDAAWWMSNAGKLFNAGPSPAVPFTHWGNDAKPQQGLRRPAWWRSVGALHPGSLQRHRCHCAPARIETCFPFSMA